MVSAVPEDPQPGWESAEVAAELPGLHLLQSEVAIRDPAVLRADSPPDVLERLHEHSSRLRGPRAIGVRSELLPAAYRVFYRQIGLDPDIQRTPLEAAVFDRVMRGGFPSRYLLADILLIALLDTGAPVWALDAGSLDGPLGVRTSRPGEQLGGAGTSTGLEADRLVVADASHPVAMLFGDSAPGHEPGLRSARVRLFGVQVPGVPALFVEESLWSCGSALLAH